MLIELEYRQAPSADSVSSGRERSKGPWPTTSILMRAWRQVNTRLTEVYQYMNLIFGTATYAPAPPSSHIQQTAHAIFELLSLRLEQLQEERKHSTRHVSDTSECRSRLALAEELLGGVIGNQDSNDDDDDEEEEEDVIPGAEHRDKRRKQGLYELREAEAWRRAKTLLQDCSTLDTLLQVTIDDGPNILLTCILNNDEDVLQLLIAEGIDLNHTHCTLPLHLAASLGNLSMVRMLLSAGANPTAETGMCYPRSHVPIRHVPSRFHFLETDIYACDSNHRMALLYAIEGDHVETVRCLLEFNGGGGVEAARVSWPYSRYPLHYACAHGAIRCVQYLVSVRPEEINAIDEDGLTPLLHAVQWGHQLVKFLVEAGADVHAKARHRQGALHLLYTGIQNPLELYTTTKFLLGTGMEQDVSTVDAHGNSPLHCLMARVNRLVVGAEVGEQDSSETAPAIEVQSRSQLESLPLVSDSQRQFDNQVVDTVDLLLSFNCDANLVNGSGVTALHKLLLSLEFLLSSDLGSITLETLPSRQQYKVDFDMVTRTMTVLLQHAANPNALTTASRSPLVLLLQLLATMEASIITSHGASYLRCLEALLIRGAQPSLNLHTHLTVVALMTRCGHRCIQERDRAAQDDASDLLEHTLTLLLRYGLDSNHSTRGRKAKYLECTSGNILLEMVRLAAFIRQPDDLLRVRSWVLTLLQGGADPDVEPYPSDPIICHSQGSIFLKPKGTQAVNQYMYDVQDFGQIFDGGYAEMLLLLFFNTMDHVSLYQCMNTAKFLSRFDPNRAPSGRFLQLIHTLSSRPRSLQQIARVAIYKAIGRQLSAAVPHLPLPGPLQSYLLNVE